MATLNTTANLTQITAPRVPLIDERTGLVSREWYRFFLSLYDLTGGGQNNTTLTDLQVGPPPAQQEDLTGLVINIESLKTQPNQESALEQISELEKQIQGLATAIGCACSEVAAELQKQIDALNVVPLPNISASLTSGTSILYGNGSGGFSNVSIGSGITFSGGTLSAAGTGGTVTSVSGTAPVASSGGTTPVISLAANYGDAQNPYASKTANFVLAAPNGGAGNPTFRAIVAADIPILNQNTTGNAATVTTNANLTGAVTSVGNAASLGSFTSAQLATALTDETGTGANVFATSPTLVTPALGTPSSGIVTNLTGTASININGTVGATTAAAGTFTTLTSTAGANFATSSGNVGVGTASPAVRLHVKGIAAGALRLEFNATSATMVEVNGSNVINGVDGSPNGNGIMRVFRDSGNLRSISAAGSINASGADYAEYMTKANDFVVAKGDIVGINANGKLTNIFADAISFVVKSTDPSYVGNDKWAEDYEGDAYEAARQLVDRIAFAGQVPVNVTDANPGDYIVPVNDNGAIMGVAVSNPTFEQYQQAVGKVIAIEQDGRARILVKVA